MKKFFLKKRIFFLKYFFYKSKFYNELKKKSKKIFLTKLKIMMLIISPKRKNTILEMALKSLILSKLDHQMSKSWKRIVAHAFETTNKFDKLKNWVPDCSAQNMSSRCTSRPVGEIQIFLPLSFELVWLKIHHLI